LFAAAALAALALCTGCAGPRAKKEFVEQARRLHQAVAPAVVSDTDLAEYVQVVGDRLMEGARGAAPDKAADASFARVKFHVVNADLPNVVTTGGAHVYVYSGLLRPGVCDTEEELAAALAHAVAHALNLDVQNTQKTADPRLSPPAVAWRFVTGRFSPQQEWAADKLAFAIYTRAGWDPDQYGNLYLKLSDRYPGRPENGRPPLAYRTEAGRVSGVEPQRRWRRPPVADRRTFTDLRRRAHFAGGGPPGGGATTNPAGADAATAVNLALPPEAEIILWALPNCILPFDLPGQVQAQDLLRPRPPPPTPIEPS
jgi:hypothetical protein